MIIVTGASGGIGKAICERLIKNRIDVTGICRNTENLSFPSIKCDVSSYEQVKDAAKKIKLENKKIRALINTAGVASMNLAITTPASMVEKIINTNLIGTIYCCQQFSPLMIREKQGRIINFSTISVPLGLKGESIYTASKAGVEGFTKSFAREMADFNITVNCISPGPIDTKLLKGITKEQIKSIISRQIIQKQFATDDICDAVELLLNNKSNSISGQILHIGGV